jgi:hypothetical protein
MVLSVEERRGAQRLFDHPVLWSLLFWTANRKTKHSRPNDNLHFDLFTNWVLVCSFRSKIFDFFHTSKALLCLYSCDFVLHSVDETVTGLWNRTKCAQRDATTTQNVSPDCKEGSEFDCLLLLPGTASVTLVTQTYRCGRWLLSNNYLIVLTVTQGTTVTRHCIRPSGTGFITLVALFLANVTLPHTHTQTQTHTPARGRPRSRDKFLFQSLQFSGLNQQNCGQFVMNNEDQIKSKPPWPIRAQLMEGMTLKDFPIYFSSSKQYTSVNRPHTYFCTRLKIRCKILHTVTVKHTSLVVHHVQCQFQYLLTLNLLTPTGYVTRQQV